MTGVQLDENDEKAKHAETFANGILDATVSMFKSRLKWNRRHKSAGSEADQTKMPEICVTTITEGSSELQNLPNIVNVAKTLMVADEAFQRKGSRKFGSFKRKNEKKSEKRKGSFKRLLKKEINDS